MSSQIQLDLSLTFNDAKDLVKACINNKEPIMLWGMPGIGKSDLIRAIGKELNREIIDIRACLFESVDVKGYPYIDKETNSMKFALSNEFPTDPNSTAIIFLDELPAALPSTQLALYQLILDRGIGQYSLPEGVTIVAAGNRENDKAGTFAMPKPLENRFVHVEVEVNFGQWKEWAITNSVNKDIILFLNKNSEKICTFNPENSSRAFATPRSWTKASKLLNASNWSNDQTRNIVSGCVGVGLAAEFMGFKEVMDKLPEPMDILEKKVTKIKEVESSICYAVVIGLLYKLRELSKDKTVTHDKWHEYAENFFNFLLDNEKIIGAEFIAMACSSGYSTYALPLNAKIDIAMMKAVTKYQLLFNGI